ncbi:hypothetical protein ISH43_29460 [Pseudomonas aeruginosa]|uniref:hypothetical protein n=1 Tax=Pseudomonas aeruginosa TaxID=287 RepID=UPI001C9DEA5C|nr:hypothetical protein [Pseudomonas aeruginosa]MBY9724441.1 hypothetical protein [Pseudomonas aeruginosa]QZV52269.1 hypothetical protein KUU73_29735 [Pseudomonas aeruginosa]HCF3656515.1 hypothetical protein [Pseudomonas aeruginosa]
MVKPRSATAAGSHQTATTEQAERLAQELADKPYGKRKDVPPIAPETNRKAVAVGISLPPDMIERLQDAAHQNKRAGSGQKTVSGIIRELLEQAGY